MRAFLILVLGACGASPPPPPQMDPAIGRAISIEWRAAQGEGHQVIVSLVVDGKTIEVGPLEAATETEPGTPNTCALRAAHPLRTEFLCGDLSRFYAAELASGELAITLVEPAGTREIKRVPVYGEGLAVKPYALPQQ